MVPTGKFSRELTVFEHNREAWLRSHPGAFVAIQNEIIAEGFFETYAEALRAGLQKFDIRQGFLVKQVWTTEPVYVVS